MKADRALARNVCPIIVIQQAEVMMEQITVSVIIPVYNVENYLSRCLDSVFEQDYQDFEVICVEDGSTDRSPDILKSYQENHPNMRIIQNRKNYGLSYSRNRGIDASIGEYIIFVDSDDVIHLKALALLVQMGKAFNPDIIFFDYEIVYGDDMPSRGNFSFESSQYHIFSGEEYFCYSIQKNLYSSVVWAQFYHRDFLIAHNLRFYEGLLHEDVLFTFQVLMCAQKVIRCNEKLYFYRKHLLSITGKHTKQRDFSLFFCMMEIARLWHESDCTEKLNVAIEKYEKILLLLWKDEAKKLKECNPIYFGSPSDKFFYDILRNADIKVSPHIHLTKEMMDRIKEAESLYIYGAGMYGMEMLNELQKMKKIVNAFLVTKSNNNPKVLQDINVIDVRDQNTKKNGLVIVAVRPAYVTEVLCLLRALGYNNYMIPYEFSR